MLVKASPSDAPLSTNGMTSGGFTLSFPGCLVLVETRALLLCLDVSLLFACGSTGGSLGLAFMFFPGCTSQFVPVTKFFDWFNSFADLLIVLTIQKRSVELVPPLVYAFFSY